MLEIQPNKSHWCGVLFFSFHGKKTAAQAHRMIVEVYGDSVISDKTCREWFRLFKTSDLDVEDVIITGHTFGLTLVYSGHEVLRAYIYQDKGYLFKTFPVLRGEM